MNRIREVGRIRWICFSLLFSHEKRDFGLRRSEDLMSQTSRNGGSSAELCHSLCGNTNLCITHLKAVVGMGCLELNPNHLISLSKDYPFTYYSNCTPPRRASIICFYKLRVPTYSSLLWCWLCKPQKRTELENWACAWRHSAGRQSLKVRASRPSSVLEGWLEEGSPQRTGDHSVPFSKRPWPILPSSLKLHSEAVYKSVWPSCRSFTVPRSSSGLLKSCSRACPWSVEIPTEFSLAVEWRCWAVQITSHSSGPLWRPSHSLFFFRVALDAYRAKTTS